MLKLNSKRALATALPAALALLTLACDPGFENTGGNGGEEQPPAQRLIGAGANNVWLLDIEQDDDFDLVERTQVGGTLVSSISGEYHALSSGFSQLTVSTSNGNNTPADNAVLPALNLSDSLMLVQSWTGNGGLLFFAADAECPTGNFSANWLQVTTAAGQTANSATSGFFGSLTQASGSNELQIDESFALTPDFPEQEASDPLAVGNCADGASRRNATRVYYGENGTAVIQQNAGTAQESLWLALPSTLLTAADISGQYVGFWTDTSRSGNERLWNVTMECTGFECAIERISDIENLNSVTGATFEIALDEDTLDQPVQGYLSGTLTPTAGYTSPGLQPFVTDIVCSASQDFNSTGDKVLICVGQSPNDIQRVVNGFFVAAD